MAVIKYGDMVHIMNGDNAWKGGYLGANGHSTAGNTYNVSTNKSQTRDGSVTGTWMLVSGSKAVGKVVITATSSSI